MDRSPVVNDVATGPRAAAQHLRHLVAEHTAWRESCLNLVAAETLMSAGVRLFMASDLVQRYADYQGRDLRARKYFGTRYIIELEEEVDRLLRTLFGAPYVEARALSGHVAGAAALMAFTSPGDLVMELDGPSGGHRIAEKLNSTHYASLRIEPIPFDSDSYNIDVDRTIDAARRLRPRVIVFGSSLFLFPHPVRAIADALVDQPETLLAYDASHVLGLLAGHAFQDPLREGASIVWSSTHKSFPGPPGGIILATSEPAISRVSDAVYPGLVTNHHPGRMPALGLAAAEMQAFGADYAAAIIANAQALGQGIHDRGIPVVGAASGFTRSHTVVLQTAAFGDAKEIGARLEESGIITTASKLPASLGGSAIRLGLQEITRRGATASDMPRIADLVADTVTGRRSPTAVRSATREFAASLTRIRFTFDGP